MPFSLCIRSSETNSRANWRALRWNIKPGGRRQICVRLCSVTGFTRACIDSGPGTKAGVHVVFDFQDLYHTANRSGWRPCFSIVAQCPEATGHLGSVPAARNKM